MFHQFQRNDQESSVAAIQEGNNSIQQCANFLRMGNGVFNLPRLQTEALFWIFGSNPAMRGRGGLPQRLERSGTWYEYRRILHDPDHISGSFVSTAIRLIAFRDNFEVEFECYSFDVLRRQWDWNNRSIETGHIIAVNGHTELVVNFINPEIENDRGVVSVDNFYRRPLT